jgi:hypothetical protein
MASTVKMKSFALCIYLIFVTGACFGQNKFLLNSLIGQQIVLINGKQYFIDSTATKIPTQYPRFDTLIFKRDAISLGVPIICNFKPDSNYSITIACCAEPDITEMSKLNCDSCQFWDLTTDLDKIHRQFVDKPFISIRTKIAPKDSIYAWHADAACRTQHKLIGTDLWRLGVPPKCFYWSNITTITFFKTDPTLPKHEETDMEQFLRIKNIVNLASVSFRLFDDQRFILTFDENANSVILQYE